MTGRASRPVELTPEAMASRLAPHIQRVAGERASAKDELRSQFPLMAELVDAFRAEGMKPRPVFARNDAGETWGHDPDQRANEVVVDGDKLAHLPEYESAWRRILGKQPDNRDTYRLRAQRGIKPNAWRVDE